MGESAATFPGPARLEKGGGEGGIPTGIWGAFWVHGEPADIPDIQYSCTVRKKSAKDWQFNEYLLMGWNKKVIYRWHFQLCMTFTPPLQQIFIDNFFYQCGGSHGPWFVIFPNLVKMKYRTGSYYSKIIRMIILMLIRAACQSVNRGNQFRQFRRVTEGGDGVVIRRFNTRSI